MKVFTPLLFIFAVGACADEQPTVTTAALTAVCVADVMVLEDGDWRCDEPRVVECADWDGTAVSTIYVVPDGGCADLSLTVSDEGPFVVGDTTIVVSSGDSAVCSSQLTVVDTTPPRVTPKVAELWPPNHKMHRVTPYDCLDVVDACDPDVRVWFTDATSNEVDNGLGDGDTEGDIGVVEADGVELRAERSGTGTGRVYTLGWQAEDAAGNAVAGTCDVVVPHDQGQH